MKKLRLRKWVKALILTLIILGLGWLLLKADEDFIKGCMSNGYSREYCVAHR